MGKVDCVAGDTVELEVWIKENIKGEPKPDEGVGESALRILKHYRFALKQIAHRATFPQDKNSDCEIARKALGLDDIPGPGRDGRIEQAFALYHDALSLTSSMILSGEAMSDTARQMIKAAFDAAAAVDGQ